jgi:repressor LexA
VSQELDSPSSQEKEFISIPVYGLANCGPALFFASPTPPEQHLSVSRTILGVHANEDLYAVRAIGNSLNRADFHGKNIEEGDYVVVSPESRDHKTGDYILSVINDLVNIKRMVKDDLNKQVVLISESTEMYPPIYIHARDFDNYQASAKVVEVLKQPKMQIENEDVPYTYEKLQGAI